MTMNCVENTLIIENADNSIGGIRRHTHISNGNEYMCIEIVTVYYDTGELHKIIRKVNNKIHMDFGPAIQKYSPKGCLISEIWYNDGDRHRDSDLPAKISYYNNGRIRKMSWYKNGSLHREYLPAVIRFRNGLTDMTRYYINGLLHRNDGLPAISYFSMDGTTNLYAENGIILDK